jgi:hypothetical protein
MNDEGGPQDSRLSLLLGHLDAAWEMLDARLHERLPWSGDEEMYGPGSQDSGSTRSTLSDDEYFWEPVAGSWSLRRRGHARSEAPWGRGEWQLDGALQTPRVGPFTTIAWRMCHICVSPLFRYDYTFGSHALTAEDIEWPGNAEDAVRFLSAAHSRWRTALASMDPAELDVVGRSQYSGGLDPDVPFADLVAWTNTEFIHHAAEIGCLRDLYRYRFSTTAGA